MLLRFRPVALILVVLLPVPITVTEQIPGSFDEYRLIRPDLLKIINSLGQPLCLIS